MKGYSTSLLIRVMQIKPQWDKNSTRMAKPKLTTIPSVGKDMQEIRPLRLLVWLWLVYLLWYSVHHFLVKLNLCISYNLLIPLLGIYANKMSIKEHWTSCTFMFTAGLFIIATFGNNIHQHGMDKQIEYLHHGTLALKKNEMWASLTEIIAKEIRC